MNSTPSLPFLPFALPEIGDEEIAEVVDTLKSGWVTTGPKTKRFEADFAAWLAEPGGHDPAGLHCIAVTRPPPACTWRSKPWGWALATR